jgi:hypothetical protein
VAGWWTVLIACGFLTLVWLAYLCLMSSRPAWLLGLWGPDIHWSDVQYISLWAIAAFKLVLWLLALVVVWLTLWAWQLKKHATAE